MGNIIIYSYDPLDPTSRSGRRLVRRADMRLPCRATCSLRVANRLRHALLSVKPNLSQNQTVTGDINVDLERYRHSVYFGKCTLYIFVELNQTFCSTNWCSFIVLFNFFYIFFFLCLRFGIFFKNDI